VNGAWPTLSMSAAVISRGTTWISSNAIALGPTGCHASGCEPSGLPPRHGASVDALRPAWAN
jgi:hypothetical protein